MWLRLQLGGILTNLVQARPPRNFPIKARHLLNAPNYADAPIRFVPDPPFSVNHTHTRNANSTRIRLPYRRSKRSTHKCATHRVAGLGWDTQVEGYVRTWVGGGVCALASEQVAPTQARVSWPVGTLVIRPQRVIRSSQVDTSACATVASSL